MKTALILLLSTISVSSAFAELTCSWKASNDPERFFIQTEDKLQSASTYESVIHPDNQLIDMGLSQYQNIEDVLLDIPESQGLISQYGIANIFIYYNSEDYVVIAFNRNEASRSEILSNLTLSSSPPYRVSAVCADHNN